VEAVIREIEVSDGSRIEPPGAGVLVVVGPNNAGKSALLRELWMRLTGGWPADRSTVPLVARAARVDKQADSDEELQEWFETHSYVLVNERTGERSYRRPAGTYTWNVLLGEFRSSDDRLGPSLANFLAFYGTADARLGLLGGGATLWDPMSDTPTQPLQMLYADQGLERRLSDICFEAFRQPLTLARIPGSPINLHVGATEYEAKIEPTPEYMQAIREMPLLASQGDGMRSFMGVMLTIVCATYPIILLDEPEAFLHPPQARLLGRKLAEESGTSQVLVATHDSDFLAGALDVAGRDVAVVRLTRRADVNRVSSLSASRLREVWNDPILRYSNILDGLFHRGVIACESDADSRYYGAVLDAARIRQSKPPHDLLLTQAGGVHRLPVVVEALQSLEVPAAVIVDFDVLRHSALLRRLVEAFGRDWALFQDDWRVVDAQVRTRERNVSIDYAAEQIRGVLEAAGRTLTPQESERIRAITKVEDGWSMLKTTGLPGVPAGDGQIRCRRLLDGLKAIGIFVVPIGELEAWHSDIGGHGPSWVVDVLAAGHHDRDDTPSNAFVDEVATYLEGLAEE